MAARLVTVTVAPRVVVYDAEGHAVDAGGTLNVSPRDAKTLVAQGLALNQGPAGEPER